ncbi:ABC transporter ATP-binding protein [Tumebacillus lipolyticus]|uniref:ABC transporter ATP-binding protein n=1 Tax=Tumebacillus lipolyticus TaxID=1280370 RepID=A0ABW4ZVK6_9BACL
MELRLANVSKNFGKVKALEDISLTIPVGMFGLLGPNGAGKTTLMRILTTLLTKSEGHISFGDINWDMTQKVRGLIGYLPQNFSLYKQMRVEEVLNHLAVLKGLQKNRGELIEQVLQQVNLSEHKRKKIGQLSGGMIRRVGIAQAILGNPSIIVIDEPTAGLDPEERIRFRKLLRQLGEHSIVIISTHIVEDIESTCDRAAILNRGKLIAHGQIRELGALAAGKVWTLEVTQERYYEVIDSLQVISSHRVGDGYQIRFLADVPPAEAISVSTTLEDGYLHLMRQSV